MCFDNYQNYRNLGHYDNIDTEGGDEYMDFSEALAQLKAGAKMTRVGWNGKGLLVQAQFPDENSKMGNPYLYIDATALGGKLNPWLPSQTDLFATDWGFAA